MSTLLLTHDRYLDHDMGPGHPERPERLVAIQKHLDRNPVERVRRRLPSPAPPEAVLANHDAEYVEAIRRASEGGRPVAATMDTVIGPATFDAALLASGACLLAVDEVMAGAATNAFSLHRPPGHHAEGGQAMGFCFFNHVAVAARHLLAHHGLQRVAIIDWDVHHGNGTQNSFYADGRVLYVSLHQHPHYPFTGHEHETGHGPGTGTTLNVPLPPGQRDEDYRRALRERVRPAMQRFEPEFLLLSAGFDAHHADPLGNMALTESGFGELTEDCLIMAADLCDGRLASFLEGGYDLEATARSVEAHLQALSRA